jgi:hypothetical protein
MPCLLAYICARFYSNLWNGCAKQPGQVKLQEKGDGAAHAHLILPIIPLATA